MPTRWDVCLVFAKYRKVTPNESDDASFRLGTKGRVSFRKGFFPAFRPLRHKNVRTRHVRTPLNSGYPTHRVRTLLTMPAASCQGARAAGQKKNVSTSFTPGSAGRALCRSLYQSDRSIVLNRLRQSSRSQKDEGSKVARNSFRQSEASFYFPTLDLGLGAFPSLVDRANSPRLLKSIKDEAAQQHEICHVDLHPCPRRDSHYMYRNGGYRKGAKFAIQQQQPPRTVLVDPHPQATDHPPVRRQPLRPRTGMGSLLGPPAPSPAFLRPTQLWPSNQQTYQPTHT